MIKNKQIIDRKYLKGKTFEDFTMSDPANISDVTRPVTSLSLLFNVFGSPVVTALNSFERLPGILRMQMNSVSAECRCAIASKTETILFSSNVTWLLSGRLGMINVGTGTEIVEKRIGFMSSNIYQTNTGGIYLFHDNGYSNWQFVVKKDNTSTVIDSGIPAASAYYRFKLGLRDGIAYFFLSSNAGSVERIVTPIESPNIPTDNLVGIVFSIRKISGVPDNFAEALDLEHFELEWDLI